jgi:hypothetical protein
MAGLSTMPSTGSLLQKPRLNSWKEIAVYLDRGVRTVQRWEQELGLPVHRISKSDRGPVFTYRHEIDRWLEACARNPQYSAQIASPARPHPGEIHFLKHDPEVWNQIRVSTESIRSGTEELHKLIGKLQSLMRQDSPTPLGSLRPDGNSAG